MSKKGKYAIRCLMILLLISWMALIFRFSNQPGVVSADISNGISYRIVAQVNDSLSLEMEEASVVEVAENIDYPLRKSAHMTEYAILCLLCFLTVLSFGKSLKIRNITSLIFAIIYASSDEIHQLFVIGRSGKATDVFIDATGACIMLLLVNAIILLHNRRVGRDKNI